MMSQLLPIQVQAVSSFHSTHGLQQTNIQHQDLMAVNRFLNVNSEGDIGLHVPNTSPVDVVKHAALGRGRVPTQRAVLTSTSLDDVGGPVEGDLFEPGVLFHFVGEEDGARGANSDVGAPFRMVAGAEAPGLAGPGQLTMLRFPGIICREGC